jgi:hypothetical protein
VIREMDYRVLSLTGDLDLDIMNLSLPQEEETAVPWSGPGGEQVQYGGIYYPPMPAQTMHYPIGNPVSISWFAIQFGRKT